MRISLAPVSGFVRSRFPAGRIVWSNHSVHPGGCALMGSSGRREGSVSARTRTRDGRMRREGRSAIAGDRNGSSHGDGVDRLCPQTVERPRELLDADEQAVVSDQCQGRDDDPGGERGQGRGQRGPPAIERPRRSAAPTRMSPGFDPDGGSGGAASRRTPQGKEGAEQTQERRQHGDAPQRARRCAAIARSQLDAPARRLAPDRPPAGPSAAPPPVPPGPPGSGSAHNDRVPDRNRACPRAADPGIAQ